VAVTSWQLVDDVDHAIPPGGGSAAENMAADAALLDDVIAGGTPALRLYRWTPPALSLGRFQPDDDVDLDACVRHGVDVIRRPTGGQGLLHGPDLTYAVVMPLPTGAAGTVDAVYGYVAAALIAGLARIGVDAAIARHDGPAGPVCFAGQQGADLRVGDRKLCGSAQVRRDGAVLQHGSILLTRLGFDETDLLRPRPGAPTVTRAQLRAATVTLDELGAPNEPRVVADALVEGFARTLDVTFDLQSSMRRSPHERSSTARRG
jgi:lipoate-protein ligase A